MSIEWERKFEVTADSPIPRLTEVGPVAEQSEPTESQLDATYFDTRDFRLARAGITLRRRTGGHDEGWHLKLPVAPEQREEIHVPLGENRTKVPSKLARLVTAWSLGEKLVPIAHIATVRFSSDLLDAEGKVLATLADDRVTAEAGGDTARLDAWRELEIELVNGSDPRLLDGAESALRKLGARPAKSSSKLARVLGDRLPVPERHGKKKSAGFVVGEYLRAQAELLRTHDVGVRTGKDDAVHQMRVASRRLRSALSSFRRVLDRDATGELAGELRWLGRKLAPARDTEVLEELLNEQVDSQPGELVMGPVRASFTAYFAREEANAGKKALSTLDSPRYLALLRSLDRLLTDPPLTGKASRRAAPELGKALRRASKRLRRAENALASATDRSAALHEVRKKAKQARYTGEAAAPAFGKRLEAWTKKVKKIQSTLGDHHDRIVARELVRQLGVQEHLLAHNAFTYGLLHRHNTAEADQLEAAYRAQWSSLASMSRPRWLTN
ncbi:CYTH and CHAD domain-containing protein [Amycolatopsis sp.]|jgi:CHAD domain-containing protein|uniref:CYTH and CHAD domain-containing protein n=1 Tax=Amycolatopsis sp. TaxID=37632 RepID=UPI002DFA0909|nr:CYTH and CHAD domain-containing protein [Amycolatopsis sp.]